eukprot:NODE_15373_length_1053_cov_4.613391.p2 GENE.NODE_15373_length_1053_cov_4.613391~~NODE_15373_length_1053_cov_4.613391.p2  ORF type:complete len:229 (+),score=60.41 NODE_15373_length_1053_cov_4.613391:84-770(+)
MLSRLLADGWHDAPPTEAAATAAAAMPVPTSLVGTHTHTRFSGGAHGLVAGLPEAVGPASVGGATLVGPVFPASFAVIGTGRCGGAASRMDADAAACHRHYYPGEDPSGEVLRRPPDDTSQQDDAAHSAWAIPWARTARLAQFFGMGVVAGGAAATLRAQAAESAPQHAPPRPGSRAAAAAVSTTPTETATETEGASVDYSSLMASEPPGGSLLGSQVSPSEEPSESP